MYSNKLIKKYNKKNVNDKNYKMDEEEPEISGDMVSYEDNHIYFYDDVNSKSILSLIKYIKIINFNLHKMQMDTEFKYNLNNVIKFEIYLHINSYGGYITDVLAGIDAIQNSKYPITTIIEGAAASCGSLLSIVGNKRLMTKNSSMLIHQLSGGCIGTYEQMKDNLLNSKYFGRYFCNFFSLNLLVNKLFLLIKSQKPSTFIILKF